MLLYLENLETATLIRNELNFLQYAVYREVKSMYLYEEKAPSLNFLFNVFKGSARKALRFVLKKYFREENGLFINDEFERILHDEEERLAKQSLKSEKCRRAAQVRWNKQKENSLSQNANASLNHADASTSLEQEVETGDRIEFIDENANASRGQQSRTNEVKKSVEWQPEDEDKNSIKSNVCSSDLSEKPRACIHARSRETDFSIKNIRSNQLTESQQKSLEEIYGTFESWGFFRKLLLRSQESFEALILKGLTKDLALAALRKAKAVKERRGQQNFRYCVNYVIKVIESMLKTDCQDEKRSHQTQNKQRKVSDEYDDREYGLKQYDPFWTPGQPHTISDEMFEIIFKHKRVPR